MTGEERSLVAAVTASPSEIEILDLKAAFEDAFEEWPLVSSDVLTLQGGRIRLRHESLRDAYERALPPKARREAHRQWLTLRREQAQAGRFENFAEIVH